MSSKVPDVTTREHAEHLDAVDPLGRFVGEFVVSDPEMCYLDGNSLGRLPRATIERVRRFLEDEWGTELVAGWEHWIDEAQTAGDLIGRAALGAAPGQVLALDTTSVNFYQLASAAVRSRPGRRRVISDTANFPTDRYILEGLCGQSGLELELIDDESGEEYVTPEMLAARLGDDVALVTLSIVQYRSGALHDVPRLTRMVRDAGARMLWDASHAVGAVELDFDGDGVDLAVGCTYKYGNSGPGSPAWMYVSRAAQAALQVPVQGWFAQADQFAMGQGFERAEGIRGFQIASPSIVGLRCVQTAFEMIEQAGMPAIREKSLLGTEMMIALHDAWLAPLGFELTTPREPARRGGHITLRHPDARRIAVAMREIISVIPDFRAPDSIRLAMSPLASTFVEGWTGIRRLRDLVASGRHMDVEMPKSRVT